MYKGKVKNIHPKGFGFISSNEVENDIFCPPNLISSKNLVEGDFVEFNYQKDGYDPNKLKITFINKIEAPQNPLFELALKINELSAEDYDKFCDMTKQYVNKNEFRNNITTSKIRNIFSAVQNAKTIKDIKMLRPKLAYLSGRDNKTRFFMTDLDNLVKKVNSVDELKSFKQFFEAIICYKKEIEK